MTAVLAEARGDREVAAEAYAVAATGWTQFGVVPEAGFALLGQGRCLLHMSRAAEAGIALRDAQAIFAGCGMLPALKATEALLAVAATSAAPT